MPRVTRLAIVYVVAILVLCFLPFKPEDGTREIWNRLFDAFHFPAFLVLTVIFAAIFPSGHYSLFRGHRLAAALGLMSALFIESIQPFFGRSASEIDVANGALGIGAAFLALRWWPRKPAILFRGGWLLGTSVILLLLLLPAERALRAFRLRAHNFPLLASFEDPVELALWRTTDPILTSATYLGRTNTWFSERNHSLIFVGKGDTVEGFGYNAGGSDWSSFRTLILPLNVVNGDIELSIRIDDDGDCTEYEDRFNRTFSLRPGEVELRIPLGEIRNGPRGRQLNLRHIKHVLFFTAPHVLARMIYLDNMRLE